MSKHHTQTPQAYIKRAMDKQGYTRALALSEILGKPVEYCRLILAGEGRLTGLDKKRLNKKLGIDIEDLNP